MSIQAQYLAQAQYVIDIEIAALQKLKQNGIDVNFIKACELILQCEGHVVVMGLGKSGHIGSKVASTFASTGTPAFFIHPSEASHGDMGMITKKDILLAISNSGNTPELISLIPYIKHYAIPLLVMTGNPDSLLAQAASIRLDIGVEKEACPLDLAPTASTTVALVMGDALAMALLQARGFTKDDFARAHPGGILGRRLLLQVKNIMHTGSRIPRVKQNVLLKTALIEMTEKKLGLTTIVDDEDHLIGIFTDGDIRRFFESNKDMHTTYIKDLMTVSPLTISADSLALEALNLMEAKKITSLIITKEDRTVEGVIHMHDLLRAGIL